MPTRRGSENILTVDFPFREADQGGDGGNERTRRPRQLSHGSANLVTSLIRRWDVPRHVPTLAFTILEHKQSVQEAKKMLVVLSLVVM